MHFWAPVSQATPASSALERVELEQMFHPARHSSSDKRRTLWRLARCFRSQSRTTGPQRRYCAPPQFSRPQGNSHFEQLPPIGCPLPPTTPDKPQRWQSVHPDNRRIRARRHTESPQHHDPQCHSEHRSPVAHNHLCDAQTPDT